MIKLNLPETSKCIGCGKKCRGWYCAYHYYRKEMLYGVHDLKTNKKGFRWWGIKRILKYYIYRICPLIHL